MAAMTTISLLFQVPKGFILKRTSLTFSTTDQGPLQKLLNLDPTFFWI